MPWQSFGTVSSKTIGSVTSFLARYTLAPLPVGRPLMPRQHSLMMTALGFDIKGTFYRLTDARLVRRLWEQGIPLTMIRWLASFLNNRTAALRHNEETGGARTNQDRSSARVSRCPLPYSSTKRGPLSHFTRLYIRAGLGITG